MENICLREFDPEGGRMFIAIGVPDMPDPEGGRMFIAIGVRDRRDPEGDREEGLK